MIYFFLLVAFLLSILYVLLNSIEAKMIKLDLEENIDEMVEITAHLTRLSEPEKYYQSTLKRLADSFMWAKDVDEVVSPFYTDAVEMYLFDFYGKRIDWKGSISTKKRISEQFLSIIQKVHDKPGLTLTRSEQSIASSFSGHHSTIYGLAKSYGILNSFQGLGLKRLGSVFEIILPDGGRGFLLAWVMTDKIDFHYLAKNAIHKLQSLAGPSYWFSWIDLNNPTRHNLTQNQQLTTEGLELLSSRGLKSNFVLYDHLFSISDTTEGIRLVSIKKPIKKPHLLEIFFTTLYVFIPALLLILIWKSAFNVRIDVSVGAQFVVIFGFTALVGITLLLSVIVAFQFEQKNNLLSQKKQESASILEKVDRNFFTYFDDRVKTYRRFTLSLLGTKAEYNEVIDSLKHAKEQGEISFASYTNIEGETLLKVPPKSIDEGTIENKLSELVSILSYQLLTIFNSSKAKLIPPISSPADISQHSAKLIEGRLVNRSQLQNINFLGDDTLTFLDLAIDNKDIAQGCLFVVHEPQKMEQSYLAASAKNIYDYNSYIFAAFPKDEQIKDLSSSTSSLFAEPPIWKLHDLINRIQVASFKQARIAGVHSLIAAIPGHNLKNFNLFLIVPLQPLIEQSNKVSYLFLCAGFLSIGFILFLSYLLISSLINPIKILASSSKAITQTGFSKVEPINFSDTDELESISIGLTDLVLKVREFNEGQTVKRYLLPPEPLITNWCNIQGFQISQTLKEKEIYHFKELTSGDLLIFFMHTSQEGIEASLLLSMARTAVRMITEELNVHSAYHCLRDLEEYFRIYVRKRLTDQLFVAIISQGRNLVSYCGCGDIKLLAINKKSKEMKIYNCPDIKIGTSEFYEQTNQEIPLDSDTFYMLLSPDFSSSFVETHKSELIKIALDDSSQTSMLLQNHIEQACHNQKFDSASLIIFSTRQETK